MVRGSVEIVFSGHPGGAGVALVCRRAVPHSFGIHAAYLAEGRFHSGQQICVWLAVAGAQHQDHRQRSTGTRGCGRVPLSTRADSGLHQASGRSARRCGGISRQAIADQRPAGPADVDAGQSRRAGLPAIRRATGCGYPSHSGAGRQPLGVGRILARDSGPPRAGWRGQLEIPGAGRALLCHGGQPGQQQRQPGLGAAAGRKSDR